MPVFSDAHRAVLPVLSEEPTQFVWHATNSSVHGPHHEEGSVRRGLDPGVPSGQPASPAGSQQPCPGLVCRVHPLCFLVINISCQSFLWSAWLNHYLISVMVFFLFEPAVMIVWVTSTPSLYELSVKMATHVPGVRGTGKTHPGIPHTHVCHEGLWKWCWTPYLGR